MTQKISWNHSTRVNIITDSHCVEPPEADPVSTTQLERIWDNTPVNFDTTINYTCIRGQKFKDNFTLTKQVAECKDGNIWEKPSSWMECVESER
jgi:hypothetical protein